MGITLSHVSALDAMRDLRCKGVDIHAMDATILRPNSPWTGEHWTMRRFAPTEWRFAAPSRGRHLHVLAARQGDGVRMANVDTHVARKLAKGSILYVDQNTSMVCPELLFVQMAQDFQIPHLVMLGYELCGNFSRSSANPLRGDVMSPVPAATTVAGIAEYINNMPRTWGLARAREALQFVSDNALSAPEAFLSTMYSFSGNEAGYGMGPVTLNERVQIVDDDEQDDDEAENVVHNRYPDLLFPFARLGINYEGEEGHLDISGLVQAAQLPILEEDQKKHNQAVLDLMEKREAVRAKYVDDNARDRQLASRGHLVFRATKEDLTSSKTLDSFTRDILNAARSLMGVDVQPYLTLLDDTDKARDREDLFNLLQNGNGMSSTMYGLM